MTYQAYPLQWPIGYKRRLETVDSQFKMSPDRAQELLRAEIRRLGGTDLIVSSNVVPRKDGLLYADMMKARLDDPAVAIYFKYQGKDVSMCCDLYSRPWENVCALAKGVEALRGLDRWGVSEFLERAFAGFKELPDSAPAPALNWWEILGVNQEADEVTIKAAYRFLAAKYHPDNKETGNAEKFIQVKRAYDQAIKL